MEIIILSFKGDLKKYFFIKLKYKIIIKIENINKKPIKPVSVKISR